jgi:hypothetical protein
MRRWKSSFGRTGGWRSSGSTEAANKPSNWKVAKSAAASKEETDDRASFLQLALTFCFCHFFGRQSGCAHRHLPRSVGRACHACTRGSIGRCVYVWSLVVRRVGWGQPGAPPRGLVGLVSSAICVTVGAYCLPCHGRHIGLVTYMCARASIYPI